MGKKNKVICSITDFLGFQQLSVSFPLFMKQQFLNINFLRVIPIIRAETAGLLKYDFHFEKVRTIRSNFKRRHFKGNRTYAQMDNIITPVASK